MIQIIVKRNEIAGHKKSYKGHSSKLIALVVFSLISILIQSAQIFSHGFFLGVDSLFHMNRIYETMMQIKTGDFSYFISIFGFDQSARIVNAAYGPFMSYLLGAILLLSGNWVRFQLITSFLINVIGSSGIYRLSRKMGVTYGVSILCGCMYMTTYLLSWWNNTGAFTSFGAMLIPWILYHGIAMIESKGNNFSVIGLGLSMGILLQTHLLSSFLATLALFPMVIYSIKYSNNTILFIKKLAISVGLAILVSLNVWVGMLHLIKNNALLQTAPMDLQLNSTDFLSLLNNAPTGFGIFLTMIYLSQIIIVITEWNSSSSLLKFTVLIGGFFLIMSSKFFPWKAMGDFLPVIQTSLQFPSRLQVISSVLLIPSFGLLIGTKKSKNLLVFLGIATVFSVSTAQNRIIDRANIWGSDNVLLSPNKKPEGISAEKMREIIKDKDTGSVLKILHKGTSDYLPVKNKVTVDELVALQTYAKYSEYITEINNDYNKNVKNGILTVSWTADTQGSKNIPIVKYRDTLICDNDDNELNVETTEIGTVIIQEKKGENIIKVSYNTPLLVKVSIAIAALTTLFLIVISIGKMMSNLVLKKY